MPTFVRLTKLEGPERSRERRTLLPVDRIAELQEPAPGDPPGAGALVTTRANETYPVSQSFEMLADLLQNVA